MMEEANRVIGRYKDTLDAIDALPDEIDGYPHNSYVAQQAYARAMRQVKALLHPELNGG
jgi:hypothetical protein